MSFMTQDMPSFDHYAFNLRDGLRRAAVETLSELEGSINDLGYGWLDGYMEQIMDRQNRAPITELMKTPSRTQTVKKTRATTAAAKERTDKVKDLNAHLALSPSTKQNSRVALSPLQPRSLNVSTLSPTPVASPKGAASPIKSKPAEKAKSKPKATKKGKSKKVVENDENSPPTSVDNTSTSISTSEKSKSSSSASTKDDVVQKKSKSTRSKSKKEKEKVADEEEMAERPVVQAIEVESVLPVVEDEPMRDVQVEQEEDKPIEVEEEAAGIAPVEAVVRESSPETQRNALSSVPEKGSSQPDEEAVAKDVEVSMDEKDEEEEAAMEVVDEESPEVQHDVQSGKSAPAKGEGIPADPQQEEPERKVDPTMPSSFANRTMATGTSQPVRQVRSSWLSKALGSNAVPINGLPSNEASTALRKSYASAQRPSTTVDFDGLRKSVVPINGLKRKSDHGVDKEQQEEEKVENERRPEKTAKFNVDIPAPNYTDALPARTPGAMGRPTMPSKAPSFGSTGPISQPNSLGRSVIQTDNARSDIHKVTRALDELREKTAAKELAKQKAALAASQEAGAGRVQQAKSTGTGFLRGLGSIGAGLLGLGGSDPEEEAQRLARELEEERLAEMEFKRLMNEATRPDSPEREKEEDKHMDVDKHPEPEIQFGRSITPEVTSPRQQPQAPKSPEEEEEEIIEEQSVIEELIPADSRVSMATSQRQPSTPIEEEPQSTTPAGTPARPASQYQAPILHGRIEKHAHEPSVALQKEQQRDASIKKDEREVVKEQKDARKAKEPSVHEDEEMEEEDKLDEMSEEEEVIQIQKLHRAPVVEVKTHRKMPSSSSAAPTPLNMSTSSIATSGSILTQGQNMAAKALGVKPATGPVKSLQLAAAAAKKEQAAAERKATLKEAEARRQQAAKKKAEEDRIRADEERKAKIAEIEEKRRQRAELEKRQKERAEKAALAAKEKAEKEKADRDAQAAKLRAAEEEAARKRKLAAQTAALHKSQNKAPSGSSSLQQSQKGKEPFRPTKQATLGSSASTMALNGKMGPSAFRTAETATQSSTITLVTQNQPTGNGERKPLGPPSRPSQHQPAQPMRASTAVPSHANSILQQSRVALQTQLDEKAAMIQSEDIVLPDIASEYSDSDDEDRTKDFIPPTWAESPQLRAALEAQAHRNPDELFGPIKPLNMEELFKVKTNKFRARTSSANWSKTGDGLTKAEEIEYARRMGFKAIPSNLGGGSGSGR
ncbi:uncharacterized protein L199_003528 [Kwoniella botswanensis]|uniref:uncharacterized protein n=1 Tax=Kwoniella botswanensis TaxID=1268659 RepID=UPI00315CA6FE